MKFYRFDPHCSGWYGENTVYVGEKTAHPCIVSHLHHEFSHWPKDDFLSCLFHFIGTERLRQGLEAMEPPVTGIEFDEVEISGDEDEFEHTWREGRPDSDLGKWYWFKITGKAGKDDFGLVPAAKLVVSERVLEVLSRYSTEKSVREFWEWGGEMEAGRVPQKGAPATGES